MSVESARVIPGPRRRVAVAVMLIAAAAVMALAVAHVARRHQVVRLGYELAQEADALREVEEENRRLRLERSMLRHPDRIERHAQNLGMKRPDPDQIRVVPAVPAHKVAAQ